MIRTHTSIVLIFFMVFAIASCSSSPGNNTAPEVQSNSAADNKAPAGTPAAAGEMQVPPPEDLVADLYKAHDSKKSPFFQAKDRALVDKYFTKPLGDLIWRDAKDPIDEAGAIDFDPLYNTQDPNIKNFAVGKGTLKADTATVPVTFTNDGAKVTVKFLLRSANNQWKIDDIDYGDTETLLKMLKDTYSADSKTANKSREFEGTYQVGDTTCTVKPVKMGFEVRWAKGSGSETFIFMEGTTFASNPEKGLSNSFVFDDTSYNTGRFLRGDGKTFDVRRAK